MTGVILSDNRGFSTLSVACIGVDPLFLRPIKHSVNIISLSKSGFRSVESN